jgi:hypothetical protein
MKESTAAYEKALKAIAKDRQLDMISKKDKETLTKIAKLMQKANESVNEGKIKVGQKFNADGITWEVIKVGATQSRAQAITKSVKGKQGTYDNKTIRKFIESRIAPEANNIKESKFKSAIRDRIKVALKKNIMRMEEEDSVADTDMKTAKKLRKPLRNAIEGISNSVDNINRMMSDFNAPGLRVAFLYAIKKNINTQTQKFDMRGALKEFEDYFKDR